MIFFNAFSVTGNASCGATRLMGARRGGREPGESDPINAQGAALAAQRHDDLPVAELDGRRGRCGRALP